MPALDYSRNTKSVDGGVLKRQTAIGAPISNSEPFIPVNQNSQGDNAIDTDDDPIPIGGQPEKSTQTTGSTPTRTTTLTGPTTITIRVSLLPQTSSQSTEATTSASIVPSVEPTGDTLSTSSTVVVESTGVIASPPSPSGSQAPQPVNDSVESAAPIASPSAFASPPPVQTVNTGAGVMLSGNGQPTTSGNISSSSKGLSTGAIVGVVIAISAILLLAFVFLIRKTVLRRRRTTKMEDAIQWPEEKSFGDRFVAGGSSAGAGPRGTLTPYPFTAPTNAVSSGPYPKPQPQMNIARVPPPPLFTALPPAQPPYKPSPASSNGSPVDLPNPHGARPPTQINRALPKPQTQLDTHTVRSTFVPTLPDELTISTGDKVRVLSVYDDGWGLCERLTGERGMVPMECLVADEGSMMPSLDNRRASSLRNVA